MNKVIRLFILTIFTATMFSCEIEVTEPDQDKTDLKEITLETTSTENSITLKWVPVEGCSWYFVSYGVVGQNLTENAGYQDLNNDTISYKINNLEKATEYEIKVDGKDYLSGGQLIATKTIIASTKL